MTPREKAALLMRVLNGESPAAVAKSAGVSVQTLKQWCRSASVPLGARPMAVKAEEFVRAWQTASSTLEVAMAIGTTVLSARQRAESYRRRGVPLKHMPTSHRLDWSRLAQIAEEEANGETP
jgi:hypothetical protein